MRNLFLFSTILASAVVSPVAFAQDSAAPEQTEAGATQEDAGGLADIIVTAQRRDENLQKAAIAVSAVSSETLTAKVTAGEDLAKLVPSVVIGAGGGGTNLTSIRGIGTLASNGLAEQVVALNLDGVYLARPVAANGLYYDLERVEVVKGPQGTLYGRNATAGALNIITKKPVFQNEGFVNGQVGNYELFQAQGAVNLALSDNAAIRIAGQGITRDGYLSDGYNDQKQYSGRASILVEPSDALTLQLTGDYVHFGGQGQANVISPFENPSDPYLGPSNPITNARLASVTLGGLLPNGLAPVRTDGFNDTDLVGVTGNIQFDTGFGDLTVIPAYRHSKLRYRHYSAGFPVDADEESDARSLEVRFATPSENRLRAVLGGYYFNESGSFDLIAYVLATPGVPFPGPSTSSIDRYRTKSAALFGQAAFDITDTVRLIGGLRYTNEKKSVNGAAIDAFTFMGTPITGNETYNKVNWKAGLEADVAPASLLYATVATGFKAGGFFAAPAPNTYAPETLTAYTLGSKNRFLDNKLQLNIEAFYWKYKDKQVTHLLGSVLVTENAGAATLYGLELESSFLATPDDLLSANILYNHTKYDRFTFTLPNSAAWNCPRTPTTPGNGIIDCSGNVLQQSPEWSVNLNYEHTFRLANKARIVFAAAGIYRSGSWLGDEQLPGQRQNSYAKADLDLTYNAPDNRWYLGAYVQNVTDKAVKSQSFVSPIINLPVVGLYPPRTFGARAGFNF